MINEDIIKIFNKKYHSRGHNQDYKKGNLGFGLLHYAFIRNIRPTRVLVLGSQRGYVPAICALACKDEDFGYVDFVDAGYDLEDKNGWGGIGIWKKEGDEYFKDIKVQDYIDVYPETIEDFEKYKMKLRAEKYDYIYIDGDHSYEGVKSNFDLLWDYLADGGYMAFHDIMVDKETQWGKCGASKFWKYINEEAGIDEKITLPFECGLGIIRKP